MVILARILHQWDEPPSDAAVDTVSAEAASHRPLDAPALPAPERDRSPDGDRSEPSEGWRAVGTRWLGPFLCSSPSPPHRYYRGAFSGSRE
jgi:hypothetical protein